MSREKLTGLATRVAELRKSLTEKGNKKVLASQELEKTFEYESLEINR